MKLFSLLAILAVFLISSCEKKQHLPPKFLRDFAAQQKKEQSFISTFNNSVVTKPFRDENLPRMSGPVLFGKGNEMEDFLTKKRENPPEFFYMLNCLDESDFEALQPKIFEAMKQTGLTEAKIMQYTLSRYPGLSLEEHANPEREISWIVNYWQFSDGKVSPMGSRNNGIFYQQQDSKQNSISHPNQD